MSEIPFIHELGDRLELMIATQSQPRSRRWRWLPSGGHHRLMAIIAVLLIGGGAATAATVLSGNATTLVTRGLSCNQGNPGFASSQYFDVDQNGLTPEAACAAVMHVPASTLVVCTSPRFGVNVYIRDETATLECRRAGMAVGVPAGFAQATASVATLVHDLNHLYNSRNCFTAAELKADAQTILRTLGYAGWHVTNMATRGFATFGNCGQFLADGNSWSDAAGSLNGAQHEVMIDQGAPRRTMQDLARVSAAMLEAPPSAAARCTITGVENYLTQTLSNAGLKGPVKFAAYREPPDTGLAQDNRQARYDANCPVYVGTDTAPDGHTLLIELFQHDRPSLPAGDVPPESAYRRSIKPLG